MRIVLVVLGVLVTLVLAVVLIGYSLPSAHRASRSVTVRATPATVFALISSVSNYPAWRRDVTSVEVTRGTAGSLGSQFVEHGSNGDILYEIAEREPDRRLVVRIADPTLPFGGTWTYDIARAPEGATLRITEDGEVRNPIFRFVSRFIMGHTRTIDQYLGNVAAKLGVAGGIGP